MTIAKTLRKFEDLKAKVLLDEKVDETEVEVLLDFIFPYCQSSIQIFLDLRKVLIKSIEDGKITPDESEKIISAIDKVSVFLKREAKIERFLVGCLTFAFVFGVFLWLVG